MSENTDAPPPLPHPLTVSTTAWLLLAAVILPGAFLISENTPWHRTDDHVNTWLLRQLAELRTPWLTDVATGIKAAGTGWGVAVGLSVVVLTMVFRRWLLSVLRSMSPMNARTDVRLSRPATQCSRVDSPSPRVP